MQLSVNGRDFTKGAGALFAYYAPPVVTSLAPATGPLGGGTLVTLRGSGLARLVPRDATRCAEVFGGACDSGYKCRWGVCDCALATDCVCHNVTAATYHADDDTVLCATPDWSGDGGGAPLRRERVFLSLNG